MIALDEFDAFKAVCVKRILRNLRKDQAGAIEDVEQYKYIYQVRLFLFTSSNLDVEHFFKPMRFSKWKIYLEFNAIMYLNVTKLTFLMRSNSSLGSCIKI